MSILNFQKDVLTSFQSIHQQEDDTKWALYSYDKNGDLKVFETGCGGLDELEQEFDEGKIQYAFCRVVEPISGLTKFVLISWLGAGVPVARKGLFNVHNQQVAQFFKGFHVHVNARSPADVEPKLIMKKVTDSAGAKFSIHKEKDRPAPSPTATMYLPAKHQSPVATSPVENADLKRQKYLQEMKEKEEREKELSGQKFRQEREQREREEREREQQRLREQEKQDEERQRMELEQIEATSIQHTIKKFQQVTVAPPKPTIQTKSTIQARVLYDYEGEDHSEITIVVGEVIMDIVQDDEGWWEGTNSKNERGYFPATYVEIIQKMDIRPQMDDRAKIAMEEREMEQRMRRDQEERQRKQIEQEERLKREREQEAKLKREQEKREHEERLKREQDERLKREHEERLKKEHEERLKKEQEEMQQKQFEQDQQMKQRSQPAKTSLRAIALYDYAPDEENEIQLTEGETIEDIVQLDESWWEGTNSHGLRGLFPFNYVELIEDAPPLPSRPVAIPQEIKAVACYDYDAQEEGELSFREGDSITNIEMVDSDWWQGQCNGHSGLCNNFKMFNI